MSEKWIRVGSTIALATGMLIIVSAWRAMRNLLKHLFSDWPDWDARTIVFD